MTASAAPVRRAAQPAGRGRPAPRRLEVVGPRQAGKDIDRARLRRLVACSLAVLVVACLLGLVVSHVVLAQGQFRLDKVHQQAAAEQARYERLRLQVAELEAPSRVVAVAQERLGMVPPPGVTYLSPSGPVAGPVEARQRRAESAATAEWSRVKRELASQP